MKFTSFLDKKVSTILCILIAVSCRVINLLITPFYGTDKMWQLLQSKSFLNGKGLGIPKYFVSQLEYPAYDYVAKWPPGYPLVISPLLKLFNYDIFLATGILDSIICIALIFLVRKICIQIQFPTPAINVMTLIAGCFGYPFIGLYFPTDTISLVFFLLGISYLYQNITSERFSVTLQLLCGFFLFLPTAFRYMYLPISDFIPLIVIICGLYFKDKSLVRKGVYTFSILIIFQLIMLIFLQQYSGKAVYVNPTETGYHWRNLTYWFPVIPASFMSFPFFVAQITKNTPLTIHSVLFVFTIINIIGLAGIVYFLYSFFHKSDFRSAPGYKWYLIFGSASCAILCFTLASLSFRYKAVDWVTSEWNYTGEARYFAVFILFIQFLFLSWLFLTNSWKKNIWQKSVAIISSIIMFIEISHSIYFNTKVALNFKQYQYEYRSADFSYFNSLLVSIEKEYPDHEILAACHEDFFFPCIASYKNKKGIFDALILNNRLPEVKVKSFLVVIIWEGNQHLFKNFLANKNVKKINSVANSGFYLLELYPEK